MRPDVAAAFDRMAAAARREAASSCRSARAFAPTSEQAVLWNANPSPYLFLRFLKRFSGARIRPSGS
jgi:hypothetical protein